MNDPKERWLDALFAKVLLIGGPLVMGGGDYVGAQWMENPRLLEKYHRYRKSRNRMARESRRRNRA